MMSKIGTKAAAATKKEIINKILRKGLWGKRMPKVFKTDNLFKVTVRKIRKSAGLFRNRKEAGNLVYKNIFIFLQR